MKRRKRELVGKYAAWKKNQHLEKYLDDDADDDNNDDDGEDDE